MWISICLLLNYKIVRLFKVNCEQIETGEIDCACTASVYLLVYNITFKLNKKAKEQFANNKKWLNSLSGLLSGSHVKGKGNALESDMGGKTMKQLETDDNKALINFTFVTTCTSCDSSAH